MSTSQPVSSAVVMPVSLHTHSWYSLLEGASSPEALLERAAACDYNALALTDTNNLYGAVAFVERARRHGVRPLLGACLRQQRWRCVALIADQAGYRSLCRVLSRLHLGASGEDESSLAAVLAENAAGLHVLTDDLALAEVLREAFGPRLWLEVIRPCRKPRQEEELREAARKFGLRPVASMAAHFATPDEYPTFRAITAVRQTTLLDRLPAQLAITPEHHLADPEGLWRRFRDLPEAVRNTDRLAERLRSDVLPREVVLPSPHLPRGLEAVPYLRRLCERGLRRRGREDPAARQRLREELAVIEATDLAGYFLIVRDIACHARHRGHSMALRGSAGNSLVCYLLEITDVDPLRFDLPMERFLHLGRADLPDIDLDFDWKVRDEMIAHVVRRYSPAHTAQISTHQFLQPRSAFREAAKVHGLSEGQISQLLEIADCRLQIADCPDQSPIPSGFPLEDARWPRIVTDARRLLGRPHHLSVHPGGVVITPRPIADYVPLQRAPKGVVITQFEKDAVEQVGLVKIDLLGNRALATVDEAVQHLEPNLHFALCTLHFAMLSANDPAVLTLLRRGDTLGVNQLESPAMRHLLIQMRPAGLDDVIQALAMIRPGAASIGAKESFIRRRRGVEPVAHLHPILEPVLRETQGLMLYEDDALRVLQALTGLPMPEADRLRKRVSKHRTEAEARELAETFLNACIHNGVPRATAEEVWVQLAKFNQYSFCKSHAVSYGLIAWKALHLKAHHPLAFWTAALNNNQGMYPRRVYVEAIKRAGIALRLPCVNRSAGPFAVEDGAVRTGLDAVGTLDEQLRSAILAERQRHGPYRDLADFRRRVQPGPEALAALIRCGALDFMGRPRPALFLEAELQDNDKEKGKRKKAKGAGSEGGDGTGAPSLFPFSLSLLPCESWLPADYEAERRRRDEWELLGFVVGPPLMSLFRPQLPAGLATSRDLPGRVGRTVRLAGLVATSRHTLTADGRPMQFVTLEDEWGLIEVTLFPGTCAPVAHLALGPYLVTGRVEEQCGVIAITARRFERAPIV